MSWSNKYSRGLRFALAGLLLVAIVGPWAFDRINVPAEYPCQPPSVRLEGNFCGLPLSGFWMISAVFLELVYRVGGLFTGATGIANIGTLFFIIFFQISILLPILSTVLISWHENERRRQFFHIATWALAITAALYLFFTLDARIHWVLWGNVLYVLLAIGALVLEISVLATGKTAARNQLI